MKTIWEKSLVITVVIAVFNIFLFGIIVFLRLYRGAEPGVPVFILPVLLGGFLLIAGAFIRFYFLSHSRQGSTEEKPNGELAEKNRELEARLEEAGAESRRNEAILNSMAEGIIALDSGLKILLANPGASSIFGFEKGKDARGMSLLEFSRSEELEKAALNVLSMGQSYQTILKCYVSGTEQHFRVLAAPLASTHGTDQGVVIVLDDVSRLAKLPRLPVV